MKKLSKEEIETQKFYDSIPFKSILKKGHKRKVFFENIRFHGKVLDAGSGSGRSSMLIKKLNSKVKVTCLDISKNSLSKLPFKNKVYGSVLEMPFKNSSFDFVVSVGCLHHTPNAKKGFEECVRVLKKGGGLMIAVYNSWNTYPLLYSLGQLVPKFIQKRVKNSLIQDQLFTPHSSFHSPKQVKQWFKKNGIHFKKQISSGYTPPFFMKNYGQFVYYYGIKK